MEINTLADRLMTEAKEQGYRAALEFKALCLDWVFVVAEAGGHPGARAVPIAVALIDDAFLRERDIDVPRLFKGIMEQCRVTPEALAKWEEGMNAIVELTNTAAVFPADTA